MPAEVVGDQPVTGVEQERLERVPDLERHQRAVGENERGSVSGHDGVELGRRG